jgi:hypothetical protein
VNLEEGSGDLVQRRRHRSGDACVEVERAAGVCATLQSLEAAAAAHLSRSGAKVRRVCVAKGWSQAELCEGRRGSDLVSSQEAELCEGRRGSDLVG